MARSFILWDGETVTRHATVVDAKAAARFSVCGRIGRARGRVLDLVGEYKGWDGTWLSIVLPGQEAVAEFLHLDEIA